MCPVEGCGKPSRKGNKGRCSAHYMKDYYHTPEGKAAILKANKKWRANNREYIAGYMMDYRQKQNETRLGTD